MSDSAQERCFRTCSPCILDCTVTTVNYRQRDALQLKNGSRAKDAMSAPLNRLAFSARPPPTRANNRPDPAKNPLVGPPPPALTRCSCCANRLQLSWFIVEVGGRAAKGQPSRYRTRSAALTTVDGSARQRLLSAMAGGAFSPRNHLDLAPWTLTLFPVQPACSSATCTSSARASVPLHT